MIFPDYSIEARRCPLCNNRLYTDILGICTRYACANTINISGRKLPHYEFLRYNDDSIFQQYIIDPLHIMTQEGATTIFWLSKNGSGYSIFTARELGTKPSTMFLTRDNVDEIKRKLKTYLIFS